MTETINADMLHYIVTTQGRYMAKARDDEIRHCLGQWVSEIEPDLKYDATTLEFLGVGTKEGGVIIPARQRFIEAFPIGHRPAAVFGLGLSKSR